MSGLELPSWQDVLDREYKPWPGERIVVDTAGETAAESRSRLAQMLAASGVPIRS